MPCRTSRSGSLHCSSESVSPLSNGGRSNSNLKTKTWNWQAESLMCTGGKLKQFANLPYVKDDNWGTYHQLVRKWKQLTSVGSCKGLVLAALWKSTVQKKCTMLSNVFNHVEMADMTTMFWLMLTSEFQAITTTTGKALLPV